MTKYSSINFSSNQILFEFRICKILDLIHIDKLNTVESAQFVNLVYLIMSISTTHKLKLIQLVVVNQYKLTHINVKNAVVFTAIHMKHYYNQNHTAQFFCISDAVNLQLHWDYTLFSIQNKKLSQQFISLLHITKQIDWLIYQLNLLNMWKIHNVISIAHLKSISINNSYQHSQSDHLNIIVTSSDTELKWR